jgi:hypothetical protein
VYIVKWTSFPSEYNQWEPEGNLKSGAQELIDEYWQSQKDKY